LGIKKEKRVGKKLEGGKERGKGMQGKRKVGTETLPIIIIIIIIISFNKQLNRPQLCTIG